MSVRRAYHVNELVDMPKDQIWQLPKGGLALTFQNGERHVYPTSKTIYSSYFWKLFKEYPGGAITPQQMITQPGEAFSSDSHVALATRVFWPVFLGHCPDFMTKRHPEVFWTLSRRIYEITNEIFNDMTSMLGKYVTGLDAEDLLALNDIPELQKVKQAYSRNEIGVEEEHDQGFKAIMNSGIRNTVIRGIETGTLNKLQAKQVLISRAYVPDISGDTCTYPITNSYVEGMNSLYDRIMESRGASIAIYMQHAPLEISEYNNRMCQFLTGVIDQIFDGDCGGEHTLPWRLTQRDLDRGTMIGKFFHDPKTNELRMFCGDETDLVGQIVQVRSILTCDHDDPTQPCAICCGLSATYTPPGTNYGHYMSTEPLARISQKILGTKHVLGSIVAAYLEIDSRNAKYITLDPDDPLKVLLKPNVVKPNATIQIRRDDAMYINDINSVDRITDVRPESITNIQQIRIVQYNEEHTVRRPFAIDTLVAGKGMALTHEFLDYMRNQELQLVGSDWYEIPLDNWDAEQPVLYTSRRGEDMMDVINKLKTFLHSPNTATSARCRDYTSVEAAMRELIDLLNEHISVNFAQVEVFVRGLMAKGDTSYDLPRGGEPFRFLKLKDAIKHRSIGSAFAFEAVKDTILYSPGNYVHAPNDIPPGHRLDYMV